MTHPTDEELDALVALTEEFVTATWHLLDNSEMSGPKDDPIITVWQPNFDEVSALLDRCEGLPSGSTEHMAAGELLAANMTAAITALRAQLAEAQADVDKGAMDYCALMGRHDAEKVRADRGESALAAQIEADALVCDELAEACAMALALAANDTPEVRTAVAYSIKIAKRCAATIRNQPHDRSALARVKGGE